MDMVKYAQLRIHYNITNISNLLDNFDYNLIIDKIKSHLKSINGIIHVSVFIDIDLIVITYIGKLPNPIPKLIIPYLFGFRIIVSFELIKELEN